MRGPLLKRPTSCHHPSRPGAAVSQVHGRTVRQSKTTQGVANWDIIRQVKEAVSIPVVGNGGVETRADAERLLKATGADAVMSSEGLLENPSLFDPNMVPLDELRGIEVSHPGRCKEYRKLHFCVIGVSRLWRTFVLVCKVVYRGYSIGVDVTYRGAVQLNDASSIRRLYGYMRGSWFLSFFCQAPFLF